jgi:hypothetical protein
MPAVPGRAVLAVLTLLLGASGVLVATEVAAQDASTAAPAPVVSASAHRCPETGPATTPERGSVGLPPALRLCPHRAEGGGPVVVDEPGAVLDGWDLTGGIVVTAPGVVVQRSRITGDGSTDHGVATTGAGSVRVQDSTLTGRFRAAALGGARWTAERVEIVGVAGDGAHAGPGSRLLASVLSRFEPGSDVDGVEVRAGDVRVEDSAVWMGTGHRSAVHVSATEPGDGPVLLRRNVLGGGEYTVVQPGPGRARTELLGNRFARDAREGPLRLDPSAREAESTYLDGAPVIRS